MSGDSPDSYRLSVFTAAKLDLGFSAALEKPKSSLAAQFLVRRFFENVGRACNQN